MPDWREHPPMSYEETYGFSRTREVERDLAIYIDGTAKQQQDYADRMAAGYACPSCATPFPALCDASHLKTWEAECPNLFSVDWLAASARKRISNGFCPFCQIEVSPAAFEMLVSGL